MILTIFTEVREYKLPKRDQNVPFLQFSPKIIFSKNVTFVKVIQSTRFSHLHKLRGKKWKKLVKNYLNLTLLTLLHDENLLTLSENMSFH